MKNIELRLKGKWFQMIETGEKVEEYREIKPYWIQRLCVWENGLPIRKRELEQFLKEKDINVNFSMLPFTADLNISKVIFHYGYTAKKMCYEVREIRIGKGCKEWGAPEAEVFIIKIGERI